MYVHKVLDLISMYSVEFMPLQKLYNLFHFKTVFLKSFLPLFKLLRVYFLPTWWVLNVFPHSYNSYKQYQIHVAGTLKWCVGKAIQVKWGWKDGTLSWHSDFIGWGGRLSKYAFCLPIMSSAMCLHQKVPATCTKQNSLVYKLFSSGYFARAPEDGLSKYLHINTHTHTYMQAYINTHTIYEIPDTMTIFIFFQNTGFASERWLQEKWLL